MFFYRMNRLSETAYHNLNVLTQITSKNLTYERYKLDLLSDEKESSEYVVNLKEIDMILYFTFSQILLDISKLSSEKAESTLEKVNIAFEKIYEYFEVTEDSQIELILLQFESLFLNLEFDLFHSFQSKLTKLVHFVISPIQDMVDDLRKRYVDWMHVYYVMKHREEIEKFQDVLNTVTPEPIQKESISTSDITEKEDEELDITKVDVNQSSPTCTWYEYWFSVPKENQD